MLVWVWPVQWRRNQTVHCQLENVVQQRNNHLLQNSAFCLQAWIGVYLDQPRIELLVNHKIQSKQLKSRQSIPPLSNWLTACLDRVNADSSQFGNDVFFQIILSFSIPWRIVICIKVLLEGIVAEFVFILILAIILAMLLNGIICEVNKGVVTILKRVFVATRPDVTFLVPKSLYGLVHSHQ